MQSTDARNSREDQNTFSIVVLIVSFNARDDLRACLRSVLDSSDMKLRPRVVVVDNASVDGSADMVAEEFREVNLVRAPTNVGFAGGNNLGWTIALKSGPIKYLYLLNQDTIVSNGWLEQAVGQLEAKPNIGAGQSVICLDANKNLLNTRGNVTHFLGFTFVGGYLEPHTGDAEPTRPLGCASGAGMIVRCRAIAELGLFQDSFFMYLEDTDLSWAIRIAGYEIESIPGSVIYHKYKFKDDFRHYFHLEKNRLWLLLTFYRKRTLLLILPAIMLMEFGQFLFAATRGQLMAKLHSYGFLATAHNRQLLYERRRLIQGIRKIPDRIFLELMSGTIDTPRLQGWLVCFVANPFFRAYLWVVRRVVWW